MAFLLLNECSWIGFAATATAQTTKNAVDALLHMTAIERNKPPFQK